MISIILIKLIRWISMVKVNDFRFINTITKYNNNKSSKIINGFMFVFNVDNTNDISNK